MLLASLTVLGLATPSWGAGCVPPPPRGAPDKGSEAQGQWRPEAVREYAARLVEQEREAS